MGVPITKSEFARRRRVSKGRMSQWLREGKISGPAIIGTGRGALIDEVLACDQLDRTLDVGQRFGNGLRTILLPGPPAAVVESDAPRLDTVTEQIARERLELLQRQNRKAALDDAIAVGRLVDAAAASQATGRTAVRIINLIEAALPEVAGDIAGQFKLPQRDVLHALRQRMRDVRSAAARAIDADAASLPERVELSLADPEDGPPA